nr:type II toxin-antitoxin system RelE/ParE family toxin [uncultured Rhodopila sp.]
MKAVRFVGSSLDDLRAFPAAARREAGYQLRRLQDGLDPDDWKPMASIGPGVREIRVRDNSGAFRVIYIASIGDAIYVLHAFQKKTQQTLKRDLDLSAGRLKQVVGGREP